MKTIKTFVKKHNYKTQWLDSLSQEVSSVFTYIVYLYPPKARKSQQTNVGGNSIKTQQFNNLTLLPTGPHITVLDSGPNSCGPSMTKAPIGIVSSGLGSIVLQEFPFSK